MPTVEDYFDDDTDIPLPSSSRTLPNTGLQGALLEEIGDEDDFDFGKVAEQSRGEYGASSTKPVITRSHSDAKGKLVARDDDTELRPAGGMPGVPGMPPINPNTPMGGFMGDMMKFQEAEEKRLAKLQKEFGGANVAADPSVYKKWNTVYPLYFDAKVSISNGRRVPRQSGLWWPQAAHIAKACSALGLPSVFEPEKTHPADWENPGRVKVQIEKEGRFINGRVKNRTQLYAALAAQMQRANPTLVPAPVADKPKAEDKPAPKLSKKAEKAAAKKGKGKPAPVPVRLPSRPPPPPRPFPALEDRLPVHSPITPAGVAVSALKRDLEAEKEQKKKGLFAPSSEEGSQQKMPKMKRVVVRGGRR